MDTALKPGQFNYEPPLKAPKPGEAGFIGPVKTPIITSGAATKDLQNIKNQTTEINTGIQTQAQKLAAEKAAADTAAAAKEAEKKAQEQKDAEIKLKADALADDTSGLSIPTDPTFQGQLNRDPKVIKSVETNPDGTRTVYFKDGGSQMISADPNAPKKTATAETEMETTSKAYLAEAERVKNTILNIQNGTIPLSAGELAQVEGLKLQFEQLIADQEAETEEATGVAQIRGYQTGAAEYDPTFQTKTIGSIISAGADKVADLNIKMASAVATLTQAFKDDNIKAIKSAWDVYSTAAEKRTDTLQKTIENTQKQIEEARKVKEEKAKAFFEQVTKPIQELAKTAGNLGAPPEVINSILGSADLSSAYEAAGSYASGGTGIVGEYNFYKAQAEAAGQVPMSFSSYQNEDANRKRSIAAAGTNATNGMNAKEVAIFNSIVDKQNKSPLIAANDRAVVLKDVLAALAKDPTNAALQVSFIYSMIQALDTYQSAVREGEIGLLASTQGVGDKLTNILPKLQGGNPLSESKIKEYIGVATMLTDSIEKAAQKKKDAFTAQAKIAGIGDAFNEYQTAVGEITDDKIMVESEAKNVVDEFYATAADDVQASIEVLIGKNYTNLDILEYLQSKNLIK